MTDERDKRLLARFMLHNSRVVLRNYETPAPGEAAPWNTLR